MPAFKFKFSVPGKPKNELPETRSEDSAPAEEADEQKPDAEPTYSKAELGKGLITAVRSGDGEAVYEAFCKLRDGEPSDE